MALHVVAFNAIVEDDAALIAVFEDCSQAR